MAHRSWCAEIRRRASPTSASSSSATPCSAGSSPTSPTGASPDLPEGKLTDLRKSVVNATALAEVADAIGLGACLLLGQGRGRRRRAAEAVDPVRRARGRARRGLPRRWRRARPTTLVERLFSERLARRRRRASTGSTTRRGCRSWRAPPVRTAPVYVMTRRRARPRQARSSPRCSSTGWSLGRGRGRSKKVGRAGGGGRGGLRRARSPSRLTCLSCPRSRPSAAGWRIASSAGASSASRSAASGRCGGPRAQALIDGLTGATITAVGRRGKYLLVRARHRRRADDPPADERPAAARARPAPPRPPHTHVVLHLAGAIRREELWFVDPRTFGEMVVFDPDHVDVELPELAKLGVDPLADGLDAGRRCGALAAGRAHAAQAAAARPARDRRHRQHLLRRDPPRGRAAPRPRRRLADAAGRSRRLHERSTTILGRGDRGRRVARWPTPSTST